MTFNRAVHMYGDKLQPYTISLCVLCLGIGWLYAKYAYTEMGFGNVFCCVIALFIVVNFIDAIVKSIIFTKDHFKLTLTYKD